jgi:hypothetical protein
MPSFWDGKWTINTSWESALGKNVLDPTALAWRNSSWQYQTRPVHGDYRGVYLDLVIGVRGLLMR